MPRGKKTAQAARPAFKTIELSAMPTPRSPLDLPAVEAALEFAQTLTKRAVIAFEGDVRKAAAFRAAAAKLIVRTKRATFYQITRRKGQVFIWKTKAVA